MADENGQESLSQGQDGKTKAEGREGIFSVFSTEGLEGANAKVTEERNKAFQEYCLTFNGKPPQTPSSQGGPAPPHTPTVSTNVVRGNNRHGR